MKLVGGLYHHRRASSTRCRRNRGVDSQSPRIGQAQPLRYKSGGIRRTAATRDDLIAHVRRVSPVRNLGTEQPRWAGPESRPEDW
jgi:hypothetical protein